MKRVRVLSSTTGASLLIVAVLVLWLQPLLAQRMLPLHDLTIHLRWADQFYSALRDGWLLPRWAAGSFGGLGDPTFFYYQPLFYYISSAFASFGVSTRYALLLAAVVPYLLLAVIVHRLILRRHPHGWTLAGAVLVLVSPPLFFISTHMGLLPWTLGVPLSAMFVIESMRSQPRPARLAVLLCLTCLGHLLSGLMALLVAGLARLVLAGLDGLSHRKLLKEGPWLFGIAVGLGLAAFFVYPAVTQMHLINPDGWTSDPTFDWRKAMLFPTLTFALFGPRWLAFQWPIPAVVLGMALLVVFGKRSSGVRLADSLAGRFAIAALAAFALGSELAYPLYAWIGPMQKLQFPYRFLPLAAILATIAFVLHLAEGGWRHAGKGRRAAAVLLVLGYLLLALFLQWSLHRHGKPVPDSAKYMSGQWGQSEYLLASRGPHWQDYLERGQFMGECARLAIRCETGAMRSHAFAAMIDTPGPVTLRLPVFAFPAWALSVDGQSQALVPDPDTGLALVRLEAGRHAVRLDWAGLPAERHGRLATMAALCLLGLMVGVSLRHRRITRTAPAKTAIAAEANTMV